jgi:hypothetical protein
MIIPVSVMAGMTTLNETDMNDVTGQTGISIDSDTSGTTIGYLAWTDDDGFGTTLTQNQGAVTLSGITNTMVMTGLKIDSGSDGTTSYLAIGLPGMTGAIEIAAVKIGTAANLGGSLGAITVGGITTTASTVKIYAH